MKVRARTSTRYELEKAIALGDTCRFKDRLADSLREQIHRLSDDQLRVIFRKAAENSNVEWETHFEDVYDDGVEISHHTLRVLGTVTDQFAADIMEFIKTRYKASTCRIYDGRPEA